MLYASLHHQMRRIRHKKNCVHTQLHSPRSTSMRSVAVDCGWLQGTHISFGLPYNFRWNLRFPPWCERDPEGRENRLLWGREQVTSDESHCLDFSFQSDVLSDAE